MSSYYTTKNTRDVVHTKEVSTVLVLRLISTRYFFLPGDGFDINAFMLSLLLFSSLFLNGKTMLLDEKEHCFEYQQVLVAYMIMMSNAL